VHRLIHFINYVFKRWLPDSEKTFFELDQFPWTQQVEAAFPEIKEEYTRILKNRSDIPAFQNIDPGQEYIAEGDSWKTFFLFIRGFEVKKNTKLLPRTCHALSGIPGLDLAMFSILAPGKHIPVHRGPYRGVLRYHLGIDIPAEENLCGIRVGKTTRRWREGKSLIFDDTHRHEAWNRSNQNRVVLFVDFERPMKFPLNLLNRIGLWLRRYRHRRNAIAKQSATANVH